MKPATLQALPYTTKSQARRRGLSILATAKGLVFAVSSTGKNVARIITKGEKS